jgi:hypothetical protein
VRIRTVLDARPGKPRRHVLQTLLLAHSLEALGRSSMLEVVAIGDPGSSLDDRLRELGVGVIASSPHPLDPVGPNPNKLLGLQQPSDTPVLLVDNDICFLDDVGDLEGRTVRATFDGTAKVSDSQWSHIERATGLRPLSEQWIPMREALEAAKAGREPRTEQLLYLNAGVVWVSRPVEFEPIWSAHIDAIARAFDGNPETTFQVRGCDQAGFATAVATTWGFDVLPFDYNYLPMCFRFALSERPKILHLNKLGEDESLPFSKALTSLWKTRMIKRIKGDNRNLVGAGKSPEEQERLLDLAISARDRVLEIGADADLDSFRLR